MAFRWRAVDGPFIPVFGYSIPHHQKKLIKFGPPLTKLSVFAHNAAIHLGLHCLSKYPMNRDMCFPIMWHFDKCRLR